MHSRRPTVLLTGFGPFPGRPANATSVLVPRIATAAKRYIPGYDMHAEVLPTEWRAAPARLGRLIAEVRPVLALHFGVAGRADGFEIEARGRNVRGDQADACGEKPAATHVEAEGPELIVSTLPVGHIVARLRRHGLPAIVSRDAGSYLCNALLYRSLLTARAGDEPMLTGFIHIPASLLRESGLGKPQTAPRCRLDWDGAVIGGLEIIAASLGRPPIVRRSGRGLEMRQPA